MNRILKLSLASLMAIAIVPAFAQPKPAKPMRAATMKVTGMVKGAVKGKTFQLGVPGKGTWDVDASKATVKMKGKFFSLSNLKGGSSVTVEGTGANNKLMAKSVDVNYVPGMGKMAPTKTPGKTGGR